MPFNGGARGVAPLLSFWATFLAAVSLLLERGPLPFLQQRKRPDSLFHEKSSSFYGDGVYVARECKMIKVF